MRYIYDNYNYFSEYRNGLVRDVIEFGVYRCGSLRKICNYLKENGWYYPYVYGVDSWEGLPAEAKNVSTFSKFTPRAYKAKQPNLYRLRQAFGYSQLNLISKKFEYLDEDDAMLISPCMLIHCDADLYLSTKQALAWCFDNNLVGRHTLIAFDEYEIGDDIAGESLAWYEIRDSYQFESREIYFSLYTDKDTGQVVTQSVHEIIDI